MIHLELNKTPGKSYIYRMNSSFSKDGSAKSTVPQAENNLPTISQNGRRYINVSNDNTNR